LTPFCYRRIAKMMVSCEDKSAIKLIHNDTTYRYKEILQKRRLRLWESLQHKITVYQGRFTSLDRLKKSIQRRLNDLRQNVINNYIVPLKGSAKDSLLW